MQKLTTGSGLYRFNFCLLFLLTFAVPAISAAQELEPGRASGSVEETAIGSQDPSIMWAHYVAILECRVYGEPNLFLMFSEAPLSPDDVQDQTGKAFIVAMKPKNNIEYLYMNGSDFHYPSDDHGAPIQVAIDRNGSTVKGSISGISGPYRFTIGFHGVITPDDYPTEITKDEIAAAENSPQAQAFNTLRDAVMLDQHNKKKLETATVAKYVAKTALVKNRPFVVTAPYTNIFLSNERQFNYVKLVTSGDKAVLFVQSGTGKLERHGRIRFIQEDGEWKYVRQYWGIEVN